MDKSVEDRFKVELQKKHNVLKKVMMMPNDEFLKQSKDRRLFINKLKVHRTLTYLLSKYELYQCCDLEEVIKINIIYIYIYPMSSLCCMKGYYPQV